MRSASGGLIALIASAQEWVRADLYTFEKWDGTILGRFTNADQDLTVGGNLFLSTGPVFRRQSVETVLGVAVSEMEIDVYDDGSHTLASVAWLQALRDGALDGGRLTLDRFISDSWANTAVGSVKWFSGRVAEIVAGRSAASIKVRSDMELLNISMPRNVFQPECRWSLFDSGCGLSRTSFLFTDTVGAGSTKQVINCALSKPAGFFDVGRIHFNSGPNAGVDRMVRSYVPGALTLTIPLLVAPGIGDAFDISPGCDKLHQTCGIGQNSPIFTANPATDVLDFGAVVTNYQNDDAIRFFSSGTLPAPLTATDVFFVKNATASTIKVAATITGATLDITTAGTGIHSVPVTGKFGNILNFGGQPYIPMPDSQSQG